MSFVWSFKVTVFWSMRLRSVRWDIKILRFEPFLEKGLIIVSIAVAII